MTFWNSLSQQEIMSELRDPWAERAISDLYKWWQYDTEALRKRGAHQDPARPRIELKFWINSRRNFILEWEPVDIVLGRPGKGCDWKTWYRLEAFFGARASNELMYIKSVGDAVAHIERNHSVRQAQYDELPQKFKRHPGRLEEIKQDRRRYRQEGHAIDSILLNALSNAVDDLRDRLKLNFAVTMINEIVAVWEADKRPKKGGARVSIEPDRLVSWRIGNVEQRVRDEEWAELDRLKETCPLDVFVSVWAEADAKKPTGPRASTSTKDVRVSGMLKRRGRTTLTPSVVRRYEYLLRRFEPGALKQAEANEFRDHPIQEAQRRT